MYKNPKKNYLTLLSKSNSNNYTENSDSNKNFEQINLYELVRQFDEIINEQKKNSLNENIENKDFINSDLNELENFNEENDLIEKNKNTLDTFGTDLTDLARKGKIEECFGRDQELSEMMEILARRQKNNPILIGEAGVGKTAVVELLAYKISQNLVPFILEGKKVISLDLSRLLAGARYRGEFEGRLQSVMEQILNQKNIILFIDEIHTLSGAGSAEGSLDAANILKPVLSRRGFQCIGATTIQEYKIIEKDPALNRRFQPIVIKEPSIDATINILYGLRTTFESFHNVHYLPGSLRLAAELSARYIQERFLPDKAIDLIDRAGALEVLKSTATNPGNVIAALTNKSLLTISRLKQESFRRGDIATVYIFQEIENSYRKFLIEWLQNPHLFKISKNQNNSAFLNESITPLSKRLINTFNLQILKHLDKILFSGFTGKNIIEVSNFQNNSELSISKNKIFYEEIIEKKNLYSLNYKKHYFLNTSLKRKKFKTNIITFIKQNFSQFDIFKNSQYITKKEKFSPDIYQVSLYLLFNYFDFKKIEFSSVKKDYNFIKFLAGFLFDVQIFNFSKFLSSISQNKTSFSVIENQTLKYFNENEKYSNINVNEYDKNQLNAFIDCLRNVNPLLEKGLIETLTEDANLNLSSKELNHIYNLLGFFTENQKSEFSNILEKNLLFKEAKKKKNFTSFKNEVTPETIRALVSKITGIPVKSVDEDESKKLLSLEQELRKRVIGQDQAINAITKAIRRARLGIQNPKRPLASFLFCGPTGVGKTEVTKALAATLFGSENQMIRFDMSEFMEKFAISRLIGSPPGYVGYEEGGQLTDMVRKKPYSVVLFDEVEKAHPDVLNILLQILEDGRLTDAQKRLVSFENTVIIMTSNAGASEIQNLLKTYDQTLQENLVNDENNSLKEDKSYSPVMKFFGSPVEQDYMKDLQKILSQMVQSSYKTTKIPNMEQNNKKILNSNLVEKKIQEEQQEKLLKEAVFNRLSSNFLPEFLNRLDDIIIFRPLKKEELFQICDILINQISKRLEEKKIFLVIESLVKRKLTNEGYNPMFGARPLRRVITKKIEDSISDFLLNHNKKENENLILKIFLNENNNIELVKLQENQENLSILKKGTDLNLDKNINGKKNSENIIINRGVVLKY